MLRYLKTLLFVAFLLDAASVLADPPNKDSAPHPRRLLWGDTHVHTYNSSDAYLLMNRSVSPDDAYLFAKGRPIAHPYTGKRVQLAAPLDFMVVADHAESLGVIRMILEKDERIADTPLGRRVLDAARQGKELNVFSRMIVGPENGANSGSAGKMDQESIRAAIAIERDVWLETIAAVERHYDPGNFTTLIGWEWTSMPGGSNLHRVVIMREGAEIAVRYAPYSSLQGPRPEDLWSALEQMSSVLGAHFLAIPHNPNLSNGLMFAPFDSRGRALTADYARTRSKWEPVVEVTQIKGDSETHPLISPADEFADFEYYNWLTTERDPAKQRAAKGSYVRSALLLGLEIEEEVAANPFKLGMIGSSDTHTGLSIVEEADFQGKFATDMVAENPALLTRSAQGLAAVWAEENTREAIFEALQRREVYATTGPRIEVRFFGGWEFEASDADARDLSGIGYSRGVPMGGDLAHPPEQGAPRFLVDAVKDPRGANLDRIQIIKGWLDEEGRGREKVFDVAPSSSRGGEGRPAPRGENAMSLETGPQECLSGKARLTAVWTDPDFDPRARAFYYVRVLQVPTPRHSRITSNSSGDPPVGDYPASIRERAYSSPIWYTPES